MTVTINVNNLSLCHRGSGGVSTATMPDVCKTPPTPVPVPYPNISMSADLAKGTKTVKADGGNMVAIKGSEFSKSMGDEAGVAGGVASGVNMKESTWITFSFDVKMEGKNACRLTDKKFQNHMNTLDMAGLLQRILNPRPPTTVMNYGYWCGPNRAPANPDPEKHPELNLEAHIPADESTWEDWVVQNGMKRPYDETDLACMFHDLRLGRLRTTKNKNMNWHSLDFNVAAVHLKLLGDFSAQAANPLTLLDPVRYWYAKRGALGFALTFAATAGGAALIKAAGAAKAVASVAASVASNAMIAGNAASVAAASAVASMAGTGLSLAGKAAGVASATVNAAGVALSSAGVAVAKVGKAINTAGSVVTSVGAKDLGLALQVAGIVVSAAGSTAGLAGDALSSVGAAAGAVSAAVSSAGDVLSSTAASVARASAAVAGNAMSSAKEAISSLFRWP